MRKNKKYLFLFGICFFILAGCAVPKTPESEALTNDTTKATISIEPTATPIPTNTPKPTATPMPTSTPKPTATPVPTSTPKPAPPTAIVYGKTVDLSKIPEYTGTAYVIINDNTPTFKKEEFIAESFELYGELDNLGRCTIVYASIGIDLMPTEERGSIGSVKPTGWHTIKYDCVDGMYLYNRCHLIGWQLSGENANIKNLITGTRYMNVEGMLPFENMVADYVKETKNHVLYRVTPIFEENNLLASGVQMEAYSIEDAGEGICFNVFCYNVQPEIEIDYATGESKTAAENNDAKEDTTQTTVGTTYILNTNTKKFHYQDCGSAARIKASNRDEYTGNRQDLINKGYSPCGNCDP